MFIRCVTSQWFGVTSWVCCLGGLYIILYWNRHQLANTENFFCVFFLDYCVIWWYPVSCQDSLLVIFLVQNSYITEKPVPINSFHHAIFDNSYSFLENALACQESVATRCISVPYPAYAAHLHSWSKGGQKAAGSTEAERMSPHVIREMAAPNTPANSPEGIKHRLMARLSYESLRYNGIILGLLLAWHNICHTG